MIPYIFIICIATATAAAATTTYQIANFVQRVLEKLLVTKIFETKFQPPFRGTTDCLTHAMAEAANRQAVTAEVRVRSHSSPPVACNGKIDTVTGIPASIAVFPSQ